MWALVMVFVATVSCALICAQVEAGHKAPQTTSGCCSKSTERQCFKCVAASFVEQRKCLDAAIAIGLPNYTSIKPSDFHSLSRSLSLQPLIPAEAVFLRNGVLRI